MDRDEMMHAIGAEVADLIINSREFGVPNEIVCAAYGVKITQILERISDRALDSDVEMFEQLYDALAKREIDL